MKEIKQTDLQSFITWYTAMAHSVRHCNRRFHDEMVLGLTQTRVLLYLAAFPGARMGSIADDLILRRSTVSAAVDAMMEAGLVSRKRDEVDSRIIHGELTDKGHEALPQYLDLWAALQLEIEGWIAPGKKNELRELILSDVEPQDDSTRPWQKPALTEEKFDELLAREGWDYPDQNLPAFLAAMEKMICSYNRIQFAAKAYNLGTNLGLILCYLDFSGGQTPLSAMRYSLQLESGELTVCLDKLQRKGYIKRIIDKADRRRVFVRSTKSGKLLNDQCAAESRAIFDLAFPGVCAVDPLTYIVAG